MYLHRGIYAIFASFLYIPRPNDAYNKLGEFCQGCKTLLKRYGEQSQVSGGQMYHGME